jgi:hypothetical protein
MGCIMTSMVQHCFVSFSSQLWPPTSHSVLLRLCNYSIVIAVALDVRKYLLAPIAFTCFIL